jgi:hypothetical protein
MLQNWHGIDLSGGNVVKISIFGNGLATGQVLSFSGLDYLTDIWVRSAQISGVDISENPLLTFLSIRYSPMATIDLSTNTLLETVDLEWNDLTTVDVSMLSNVKSLSLSYNPIVWGIDVTQNPALTSISYFGWEWEWYPLTGIDLSNNPNLVSIAFYANQLSSLDLSNKPSLQYINIASNDIAWIMDLWNLSALTYIDVGFNQLTGIIMPNGATGLSYIDLQGNKLTTLDLSPIVGSNLFYLYLQNNLISDLGTNFDQFPSIGFMSPLWTFADQLNGNCLEAESLSPLYISFLNTEFANWEANQTCGRDVSESEYNALMALYNATNGANWTNNNGRWEDNSVCDWYGVVCGGNNSYVYGLHLQTNGLNWYIPPLEDLSNLVDFYADNWDNDNLADNILDIDLAAFANMPNLQSLSVFKPQSVTGSLDDLVVTGNTGSANESINRHNQ